MKKEKKVVYGIEIVKPWSSEMYAHNEAVADVVRDLVMGMWIEAITKFEKDFESAEDDVTANDIMLNTAWHWASDELKRIQRAVTVYGFGNGYDVDQVADRVMQELEEAPFYRLNEIAEELELELEKGFVGF
jgi:hypothetical protein